MNSNRQFSNKDSKSISLQENQRNKKQGALTKSSINILITISILLTENEKLSHIIETGHKSDETTQMKLRIKELET